MTDHAVRFTHGFRFEDAPADIAWQTKRLLLDLIGVAAAGSKLEASRIIRQTALSLFGAGQGGSRLLFDGRIASPAGAALANATTIDGFDAHDGHPLTKGHAGCGSLAGLLAFGEAAMPMSGKEALAHLIVAYEIAIRAGIALHRTASDYHTSGAWVALGVAALGARVMGLDHVKTREALGIAEYYGPRSQMMRCIDHPTMVKDGSGWGAMAGVTAAYLARDGFTGAPAITVEAPDLDHNWNDLGSRFRLSEQYIKAYPVCRWAQPAMEAVAQLQRDAEFDAGAIRSITIRTFREASCLAVRSPATTEQAQYSLPFPVAALLVKGRVGPSEIDGAALRDDKILALSNAIDLREDARYSELFPSERWADAEIRLEDGRVLTSSPAVARGSAENPLSDAEVRAKFHVLMESAGLAGRATTIEDMVMALDDLPSIEPLVETLMRSQ